MLWEHQSVLNGVRVHPQRGQHVFQGVHVGAEAGEEEGSGERTDSPRPVFK